MTATKPWFHARLSTQRPREYAHVAPNRLSLLPRWLMCWSNTHASAARMSAIGASPCGLPPFFKLKPDGGSSAGVLRERARFRLRVAWREVSLPQPRDDPTCPSTRRRAPRCSSSRRRPPAGAVQQRRGGPAHARRHTARAAARGDDRARHERLPGDHDRPGELARRRLQRDLLRTVRRQGRLPARGLSDGHRGVFGAMQRAIRRRGRTALRSRSTDCSRGAR